MYWGQDSIGAVSSAASVQQQRLSYYCGDDSVIDAFPLAFLTTFFDEGGLPSVDFSVVSPLRVHSYLDLTLFQTCSTDGDAVFSGTNLPNCQFMASDIETCQAKGKIVTIRFVLSPLPFYKASGR